MKEKEGDYQELFEELSEFEQAGIVMEIEDVQASPLQIVSAHIARESNGYMRDYIMDESGRLKEVNFLRLEMDEE